MNIPVKYNGTIVGYTDEDANVIEFLNNNVTKKLVAEIFKNGDVGISHRCTGISRRCTGKVDKFGKVTKNKPLSFDIIQ